MLHLDPRPLLLVPFFLALPDAASAAARPSARGAGAAEEGAESFAQPKHGEHGEDVWLDLDEMASRLAASLEDQPVQVSGFVRVNWARSDQGTELGLTDDLGGFHFDAVRLELAARTDAFDAFVSADAFTGTLTLLDAMLGIPLHPSVRVVGGQFRPPLLRSGLVRFSDTVFIARTRNGIFASLRDRGAMVAVDEGAFHLEGAVHNGADGSGSDGLYTGRVRVDLAGGGVPDTEGAVNASQELAATVGLSAQEDEALAGGEIVAAEAVVTLAPFYFQAEYVDYAASFDLDPSTGLPIPGSRSDTKPYSVTASAMVVPERLELAIRFDDFEDDLDRELVTLGANWYFLGHDAKLQLNWTHLESTGRDQEIFAVGATVGF